MRGRLPLAQGRQGKKEGKSHHERGDHLGGWRMPENHFTDCHEAVGQERQEQQRLREFAHWLPVDALFDGAIDHHDHEHGAHPTDVVVEWNAEVRTSVFPDPGFVKAHHVWIQRQVPCGHHHSAQEGDERSDLDWYVRVRWSCGLAESDEVCDQITWVDHQVPGDWDHPWHFAEELVTQNVGVVVVAENQAGLCAHQFGE